MLTATFLLVNVMFSVNLVLGNVLTSYFVRQQTDNITCNGSDPLTDFGSVRTVIGCASKCSIMVECQGFYFNEVDGACWGSNHTQCQTVANTEFYLKGSSPVTPPATPWGTCPPDWLQINSSCYKVSENTTVTLLDGLTYCQDTYPLYGAYMFQLETATEDAAVVANIMQNYPSSRFCLGLYDPLQNFVFEWMATNENVTYSNWVPGQPNGNQYYVEVGAADNFQWRDNPSGLACQPLCEISLV